MAEMSAGVGHRRPPEGNRFPAGTSGNPKGRPKRKTPRAPSAFDGLIGRTVTVTMDGISRELTLEEALQQRTLQDAFAGVLRSVREVLRWIAKREKWFAERAPKLPKSIIVKIEPCDPNNADAALVLLGVAEQYDRLSDGRLTGLRLQTWAVQAALRRPGGRRYGPEDVTEIKRCTRDAETLRWPRRSA